MSSSEKNRQNKKYQDLLKTAHDLFWKYGFKRVTIEEICREARVSKMTYYRFFPNKIELAKKVYDSVVDAGMKIFKDVMANEELSPEEKIKHFLLMKQEGTNNISQEFLQDFYDHSDSDLAKYVDEKVHKVWEEIKNDMRKAQEKGFFRKEVNMEFLIYFMNRIDYTDKEMLKFFNSPQEMVMQILTILMYGLSPEKYH